jgi:hypothetical protein
MPIKSRQRHGKVKGECTIPPAIPESQLPNLMFKRDRRAERAIREYVEWQAPDEKVTRGAGDDRICPGSQAGRLGRLRLTSEHDEGEAVPGCQRCGWIESFVANSSKAVAKS